MKDADRGEWVSDCKMKYAIMKNYIPIMVQKQDHITFILF